MAIFKRKINPYPSPKASAGIISSIFFLWLFPILWKGYKGTIDFDAIYDPLPQDDARLLGDKLTVKWDKEVARCKKRNKRPNLTKTLLSLVTWPLIWTGFVMFIEECGFKIAQPICLGYLLKYFADYADKNPKMSLADAYGYGTGVILGSVLFVIIHHPSFFEILHMNLKIRVACSTLIYRKALRLSRTALEESTAGQIMNLFSNDVTRLDLWLNLVHFVWISFFQLGLVIWVLWTYFGAYSLVGVSFLVLFIPFESFVGELFGKLRRKVALRTDYRIRIMNEIINGMRVIKMYGWETPFSTMVADSRKKEMSAVGLAYILRAVNFSLSFILSKLTVFATLAAFVLTGHQLTAENVFVAMALFQNVRQCMTVNFPSGIASIAETVVVLRRIEDFLLLTEKDETDQEDKKSTLEHIMDFGDNPALSIPLPEVILNHVSAKWDPKIKGDATIKDLSFRVATGKLLTIVGSVGSGKSSVLEVILKELPTSSGSLKITGTVAYASQEAWIFCGTVRENILFFRPYEPEWYRTVIDACALRKDFIAFSNGDKTFVGDKGITLSGGQKARIVLARAVYANSDIYLLDDPLSAVDAEVSRHLFEKCICGLLKDKVRILVTHQVQYLPSSDQIILLFNGKVVLQGTYAELQEKEIDLDQISANMKNFARISVENKGRKSIGSLDLITSLSGIVSSSSLMSFDDPLHDQERRLSVDSRKVTSDLLIDFADDTDEQHGEGGKKNAKSQSRNIGLGIYFKYFHAGNSIFVLFTLIFGLLAAQVLYTGSDYWLFLWISSERLNSKTSQHATGFLKKMFPKSSMTNRFIYFYSIIIGVLTLVGVLRTLEFFWICMRSSVALHSQLFTGVIRAPMYFYDRNPVGRILNRFTVDIGTVDELLPYTMYDSVEIDLQVLGVVVIVGVVNPYFLIPAAIIGITFYFVLRFFQNTSRALKRLEGKARSPVYSHLSTTLCGLATIRSFKTEENFEREFESHLNMHSSTFYLGIAAARWLGLTVDWIAAVFTIFVTYGVIALHLDAAAAGLAISSVVSLTRQLQWGVRQASEAENQMVSVERVLDYATIVPEAALESSEDKKPHKNWPSKGRIEFKNIVVKYGDIPEPSLKGLSLVINPLEKIGIVGRSGAGKTSFISVLFRLTEPSEGSIIIDDVNILEIGLTDLRSKISIIPQDPVLFLGTLRTNFDPLMEYPDSEIWEVLKDIHLYDMVKSMSSGLDTLVHEGGSNLSIGQRQLICMGRAILRRNRILIMDEATANVDPETDVLIQNTIRTNFMNCTVLTIAHRLHTVIDSDRILVLNAGSIQEFDEPYTLLQNHEGGFHHLVHETGKDMSADLHKAAKQNYDIKHTTELKPKEPSLKELPSQKPSKKLLPIPAAPKPKPT